MTVAHLVFSALIPCLVLASSSLHPVIFLPGFSGSLLYARVEETRFIPKPECIGALHANDTVNVNYNATLNEVVVVGIFNDFIR